MKTKLFHLKRALLERGERARFQALEKAQLLSPEELEQLSWNRRKELVEFAFGNNRFYRKKYAEAGFEPGDLKTPADFERLPILEKQEIRDHLETLVSDGYEAAALKMSSTGGSTGLPLKTYCDPNAPASEISWRTLNWWGTDISDNSAYFYRAIPSARNQRLQKIFLWPTRRNWIAALDMDAPRMEQFYRKLLKDKPAYLIGYVGAIDVFADFMKKKGYRLESLKAVWTTAAPLPEGKRQYIQTALGCPVYTQYGSCEFYWIAAECRLQSGMHIASDIRHVDVVDGNEPVQKGGFGDLVVTDLMNKAFPLIRYRLGDRGRLLQEPCSCGLPFPLMDYVDGRISDKLHLPDGSFVAGEALGGVFRGFPEAIKSFQVRQAADYSVTILYEPMESEAQAADALHAVRQRLDGMLGSKVDLHFQAGIIDVNDNGKTRFLISELEQ